MSLLEKAIEARMASHAGRKITVSIKESAIDVSLLKEVGGLFGTSKPTATIKEAFLAASCLAAEPNKRILEWVRFDNAGKLFGLIEERNATLGARGDKKHLRVSVLRWNLLVLGKSLNGAASTGPRSVEEIVNRVLRLCQQRIGGLFSANGKKNGAA